LCWCWVVFIGQRERGRPYCRPIAAHREQGFTALPRRRVSWPMGVASRARLPGFPSWGGVGLRVLARHTVGRSKKEKTKAFIFPCCTSRGRRRRNNVAQNDTVLFSLFFNMKRRRFGQNAPFHLNMAPTCPLPNQSLIYPLFI
jgi:hypothetical protein